MKVESQFSSSPEPKPEKIYSINEALSIGGLFRPKYCGKVSFPVYFIRKGDVARGIKITLNNLMVVDLYDEASRVTPSDITRYMDYPILKMLSPEETLSVILSRGEAEEDDF